MEEKQVSPLGIEGGPTQQQIDEWKKTFGDVYSVELAGGDIYLYRPMKRFEYKQVLQLTQDEKTRMFAEEKVVQTCVLWPHIDATKLSTEKAGTVATLVEAIMTASNFGAAQEPRKL